MSLPWITVNSRLQEGITLINTISNSKFNLLLKHIVHSDTEEIFTEAELVKLGESLNLNENNLQLVILSIAHIFKQSSKVILKPTVLQEQLIEHLTLSQEKAEDFVKLWTQETNKKFNLEGAKTLDNLSWEMDIQTASTFCNKEHKVNTRLQLALIDGEEKENVSLELDEEELKQFYNVLENVQKKLDNI